MTTFARYMNQPHLPIGRVRGLNLPAGVPMKYVFLDGSTWRDVTDIDWQLLAAFRRLDFIVAEGSRKLDAIRS
jgi:hypothetical protein